MLDLGSSMSAVRRGLALTVLAVAAGWFRGCGSTGNSSTATSALCGKASAAGTVVLATDEEEGAASIAVDANNVYWVTIASISAEAPQPPPDGQVLQCGKCGCDHPTVLASGQPTQELQTGIAVDGTSVYWTNGNVMKAPIGGGPVTTLAVAQTNGSIAVDATSVYWADSRGLMKMPLAGGPSTTLVPRKGDVGSIALDTASVYYVAGNGIFKVPLDGGAPTLLSTADSPDTIAVDAANAYWTNAGDPVTKGSVMKVPIGGGAAATLAAGLRSPFGLAVDATRVYWTSDSAVNAVPIAGGGPMTLVPSDPSHGPFGIVVDTTSVYWTNGLIGPAVTKLTPK